MSPFIGTIAIFAGNFAPKNYAFCNGQLLPIQQYSALYSLLGITYGGNGSSNFALPDLRGRLPIHYGSAPARSGTNFALGQQVGTETVTLNANHLPVHTHNLQGSSASANSTGVSNAVLAVPSQRIYGTGGSLQTLSGNSVVSNGNGSAHSNLQPALALNFIIALVGIYPSRP